jgi:hypothetical protein
MLCLSVLSCKKTASPIPEQPGNDEELITTVKLILTDSTSKNSSSYFFKDPDGDGGQSPFYGPSANLQTDSVLQLTANRTYLVKVIFLDETKSPTDTISNEVMNEGKDHMLFYNNGANTIVSAGLNYNVRMTGSDLTILYLDADSGNPSRAIGLSTRWRTSSTGKYPLNIVLRHQPGLKDGSYGPGDTDISVNFKYQVN